MLNSLFDHKKIALLQQFFQEPEKTWYLNELSKGARLAPATALRILRQLISLELVLVDEVARMKLYRPNLDENFQFLTAFLQQERQILADFVKQASTIEGVTQIILHGKAAKNRANIMLIGDRINPQAVKELLGEYKEKHGFTVSDLTLTKEQFDQMTAMGLYAAEKRILFTRP